MKKNNILSLAFVVNVSLMTANINEQYYSFIDKFISLERLLDKTSRPSSFPFISGDSFRYIANHIYDETNQNLDPKKIKNSDIIFLKTDYLNSFFSAIHPKIEYNYILITHNSDYAAPGMYAKYLDDHKIICWFGMNPSCKHEKFISIPIGIANRYWPHGNIDLFYKALRYNLSNRHKKKVLLGLNFMPGTNLTIRKPIFDNFSNLPFCKNLCAWPTFSYLKKMSTAKFILSPEGNGLDCHRTWEALLLGCIPIIKTSNLSPMLKNLPVLIIKNWNKISEDFLNKKYKELLKKRFNYNKLCFKYWEDLIYSLKS